MSFTSSLIQGILLIVNDALEGEISMVDIDFNAKSEEELLSIHAEMVLTAEDLDIKGSGTGTRTSFHNHADGVTSCELLHKLIQEKIAGGVSTNSASGEEAVPGGPGLRRLRASKDADEIRKNTLADHETAFNDAKARKETQVTKSNTKKTATKKKAASKKTTVPKTTVVKKKEAPVKIAAPKKDSAPKKAEKTAGVRMSSEELNKMKIQVLHSGDNPKRGSAAERYKFYRDGMKVTTYIEKVGSRILAVADLRWDQKKGWIKLVAAA